MNHGAFTKDVPWYMPKNVPNLNDEPWNSRQDGSYPETRSCLTRRRVSRAEMLLKFHGSDVIPRQKLQILIPLQKFLQHHNTNTSAMAQHKRTRAHSDEDEDALSDSGSPEDASVNVLCPFF